MANPSFFQKDYRNILDYLYDFSSCPFSELPFTDADNVVLSSFSYIPFEKFEPINENFIAKNIKDLCIDYLSWLKFGYFAKHYPDWMRKTIFLAMPLLKNERFDDVKLISFGYYFSVKEQTQFGAFAFLLPDDTLAFVFRGTDCSLIGWKEDFSLAYKESTPGQEMSADFVKKQLALFPSKKFRLMGHSKGGNFAVYAASMLSSSQAENLLNVYDDDGPGQNKTVYDSIGHQRIKNRIVHIVPINCIIGNLLNHEDISYAVEADEKTDLFNQHDLYTWKMDGLSFKKTPDVSAISKYIRDSVNELVVNKVKDKEEMETLVDALFDAMEMTGIKNAEHIFSDLPGFLKKYIRSAMKTNKYDKKVLFKVLRYTVDCFTNHWGEYLANSKAEKEALKTRVTYSEIEAY